MKPDLDLDLCRAIAESADRLISTQVYMSGGGADRTARNVARELYDAARALAGEPLTYLAAHDLLARVKPRDTVLICAGFFDPPSMITEGDGPIGAALLGRSLAIALEATPVFLTEVTNMPRLAELVRAAGLEIVDLELARATPFKAHIVPLPIDPQRAAAVAKSTFDTVRPSAMISVEKPGASIAGTYHTGAGLDVTGVVGKVDYFAAEAKARGVLSIGVGDGGNEVGMGLILDTVHDVVPTGKIMGTVVPADRLIVASIANWGTYAIEACLAAALHLPEALHSLEVERRVIDASARAGLIDPASGLAHGWVDGTPPICSESVLEILRCMVELRLDWKLRPHAMLRYGRRWFESGAGPKTVALWADRLADEERRYFDAAT